MYFKHTASVSGLMRKRGFRKETKQEKHLNFPKFGYHSHTVLDTFCSHVLFWKSNGEAYPFACLIIETTYRVLLGLGGGGGGSTLQVVEGQFFFIPIQNKILWRIDALLSCDSVTVTVSGQRLGEHVPAAMNTQQQ
jgi:hypothetical protein